MKPLYGKSKILKPKMSAMHFLCFFPILISETNKKSFMFIQEQLLL